MEPKSPQFTKTAASAASRERLRAEAAVLRRAAHPGVVQLTLFEDLEHRTELTTARIGDQNLATAPPGTIRAAVEYAASIAGTVADLHALGLVHRRLTADHVLVGPGDRPVLCGFAEASEGEPDVDVRALGGLFELLASSAPVTTARDARIARRLLALAERARTGEPPPTAGELAHSAGRLATQAARPAFGLPNAPVQGRRVALVVAAAVGMAAAVAVFAPRGGGQALTARRPTTAPPAVTMPTPVSLSSPPGPVSALPSAPALVTAGGAVFEVGREGDIVVFGDWDCDGEPGAALLRPSTGAVWVFDVLPTPDHATTGRRVAELAGARDVVADDQDNGCTALSVRLEDGTPRAILLGGTR
jgi:hypothetical protein